MTQENANKGNVKEAFLLNQIRVFHEVTASQISDFQVNDFTFEIEEKNRAKKQIQGVKYAFIIKDEFGYRNTILLWHFGLMY